MFIRNILIMTSDENDTGEVGERLLAQFEAQGYKKISELKLPDGTVKEVIMQGAVQMGSFDKVTPTEKKGVGGVTAKNKTKEKKKGLIEFDVAREK